MTETETQTDGGIDRVEEETRTFRQRVADNPGPALIWVAGLAVLILFEIGRWLSGALAVGQAIHFFASGIAGGPAYVGGNFESFLADQGIGGAEQIGLFLATVTALVMIHFFVLLVTALKRPRVLERFDIEFDQRKQRRANRFALTGSVAVLAAVLVFTPLGSILRFELSIGVSMFESVANSLPSLTDRELISNNGHRTADGSWEGTFMGLTPAQAWALRISVVFAYASALLYWFWRGYTTYRTHYREADWTPRDDTIRRFRSNYWGLFGFIVIFLFVVLAIWAPTIGAQPFEANIQEPGANEVTYFDDDLGEVRTVNVVTANLQSQSTGQEAIGPHSYDDFDRYAALGTTNRGQDMSTHLAWGARTSLIIGITAIGLGGFIAVVLSLLTAYYKGIIDVATVLASDTIISMPALLLIMMISVLFRDSNHFLAEPMDGGFLLALIFAFVYWPGLWRSIRGPSLQVAEEEWVDAAKSYGQTPLQTMRKHMAPYIAGYIMIYASLLLGSVIIFTAALTFLGLGINPPTPEWGRLIDSGQPYVSTASWHISTIPGLAIVFVVMAFNALGDALRDAIDPEADIEGGDDTGGVAAGGGG